MPHRGAGASFKLGVAGAQGSPGAPTGSPGTSSGMTEIAHWLNDIGGDAATDELDATTFDPNATQPNKYILFGATDRSFNLAGLWNASVETYFAALDGDQDVPYEYGPLGDSAGKPIIYGLCNVGAWSGPAQTALGLITFTVTLKVTTRDVATA
jgi:hypothetical protein